MVFKFAPRLFGGIEGGRSHSHAVLINDQGDVVAESQGDAIEMLDSAQGAHTNASNLVQQLLNQVGFKCNYQLDGLALALSGGDVGLLNYQFAKGLRALTLSGRVSVVSDSIGALRTYFENESGVVLIAGTGSSCRSFSPDKRLCAVGGWGHLVGDEGSAYKIAVDAIRHVLTGNERPFDHDDELLEETVLRFFNVDFKEELLKVLYTHFDKKRVASLCAHLAGVDDNVVVRNLFYEAGKALAAMIVTTGTQWGVEKLTSDFEMPVLVVGSVWKSWSKLRAGFVDGLRGGGGDGRGPTVRHVLLYEPMVSVAYGMAMDALHQEDKPKSHLDRSNFKRLLCRVDVD